MIKDVNMNGNLAVAEAVEFIMAPNTLTEKQLQLLLLLVAQVKPTDTEYNWIEIKYDDFIKMYNKNVCGSNSILSMKKEIKELATKLWDIDINSDNHFGHYIEEGVFKDEQRLMRLRLNDATVHLFLDKGRYLISKYGYIKQLHTKCAIQLYRFCNLRKNIEAPQNMKIEDAIKLFYDKDKEITVNHFFNKHLNPAIDRINAVTDLNVGYEKIYKSNDKRKVSSLRFYITKTEETEVEINEFGEIIDFDYFDDL